MTEIIPSSPNPGLTDTPRVAKLKVLMSLSGSGVSHTALSFIPLPLPPFVSPAFRYQSLFQVLSRPTMEMNIHSAQEALQHIDTSHLPGTTSNGISTQLAALSQAEASLHGAHSPATPQHTTNGTHSVAERLQLVDEHQKFNTHLAQYLQKWGLEEAGFNYNLCAVVGSQSTGKSTLLNKLFGTAFDVMNENERRQTTKGEVNGRRGQNTSLT